MSVKLPYYIARRISKGSTTGYSGKLIKLAIVTIALSITVMILSSAVIKGFKKEISNKIFGFWGNIHITDTQVTRNFELIPIKNDENLKDSIKSIGFLQYNDASLQEARTIKTTKGGVEGVSPFITFPGILKNKEQELEGMILKGVNREYNQIKFNTYLKSGRFPNLNDTIQVSREILISQQTASRLSLSQDDKVVIHFLKGKTQLKRSFNVCGIYKTGLEEYDRKFAFIDMRFIQDILGWDATQVSGLEVFIDHVEDSEPIADYIYNEILPANLYAETIQEKHRNIFEWLELQDINERIILLLMAIVALINMSTVLLIVILERTQMIGILKAIGQSNWSIRMVFVFNALYIMGLALLVGNAIGLSLAFIQKKFGVLKLDEASYYLTEVPIEFDWMSLAVINGGVIVITLIMMIIPSYLGTRILPIDILRFN